MSIRTTDAATRVRRIGKQAARGSQAKRPANSEQKDKKPKATPTKANNG
jgi:hypothetical protein